MARGCDRILYICKLVRFSPDPGELNGGLRNRAATPLSEIVTANVHASFSNKSLDSCFWPFLKSGDNFETVVGTQNPILPSQAQAKFYRRKTFFLRLAQNNKDCQRKSCCKWAKTPRVSFEKTRPLCNSKSLVSKPHRRKTQPYKEATTNRHRSTRVFQTACFCPHNTHRLHNSKEVAAKRPRIKRERLYKESSSLLATADMGYTEPKLPTGRVETLPSVQSPHVTAKLIIILTQQKSEPTVSFK